MLLSELLPAYLPDVKFELRGEQAFDHLALVDYAPEGSCCTFAEKSNYFGRLNTNVTMVFTKADCADALVELGLGACIVEKPRLTFFRLHNALAQVQGYARPRFKTQIGANCRISPLAVIAEENVVIGNDVTIEEFVVVRENTIIGDRAILRTGARIGNAGFEYKEFNGGVLAVEHLGGVILGDDTEIHANCCVDKALYPWDNTEVGDKTKVDSLSLIGHGAKGRERTHYGKCRCGWPDCVGKECMGGDLGNGYERA